MKGTSSRLSHTFLAGGMLVAPVFYLTAAVQLALRPDYDILRLPLSFLSLGPLGWIQDLNFLVTGALALLCAIGMRSTLRGQPGGVAMSLLIGAYAVGLMAAGVFGPDPLPSAGSAPTSMTVTGTLHMLAFLLAIWSLIAACFVMARRFARQGQRKSALYCVISGLSPPLLVGAAMAAPAFAGLIIALAGLILFGWVSLIAYRLRNAAEFGSPDSANLVAA